MTAGKLAVSFLKWAAVIALAAAVAIGGLIWWYQFR